VQVRFRSEAVEDVEAAKAWYNEQRDGLGDAFVLALESAVRLVVEFPEAFPEIAARHRRALLRRFPFALYYRVEGDVVEVLACLHQSVSPGTWRSRD